MKILLQTNHSYLSYYFLTFCDCFFRLYLIQSAGSDRILKSRSSATVVRKRASSPSTQVSTAATLASSASPRWVEGSEEGGGKAGADRSTTHADDDEEDEEDDEEGENTYDEDEDDEDEDEDGDDEQEEGVQTISEARLAIENKFMEIMTSMELSKLERTALRLAISRDDEIIRSALSDFAVSNDESSLISALRRAIDKTVVEIKSSQADFVPDEDSEGEDGNISPRNRERAFFQEAAKQSAAAEDEFEDEDEDEDNENDEDEYDDDEFEATDDNEGGENDDTKVSDESNSGSFLGAKSFRKHIVPILLNELEKESIFTSNECQTLLKLFYAGDVKVNAALDRYDSEHNMAQLVESFQKIAIRS